MFVFVISFFVVCVSTLEHTEYDIIPEGIIVANIKKRDTAPLQPGNRRLLDSKNLNYRRTKDIRETSVDRRFEITEALLRQAQREGQLSSAQADDIREDEFKPAQRQDDEIRTEIRGGVRDDITDGIMDELRDSIRDDVRDEVKEDVRDEMKDEAERIDNRDLQPFRNDDEMESEFLRNSDKKTDRNEDDKDHREKVQRQFSWLTIENNDSIAVDI